MSISMTKYLRAHKTLFLVESIMREEGRSIIIIIIIRIKAIALSYKFYLCYILHT